MKIVHGPSDSFRITNPSIPRRCLCQCWRHNDTAIWPIPCHAHSLCCLSLKFLTLLLWASSQPTTAHAASLHLGQSTCIEAQMPVGTPLALKVFIRHKQAHATSYGFQQQWKWERDHIRKTGRKRYSQMVMTNWYKYEIWWHDLTITYIQLCSEYMNGAMKTIFLSLCLICAHCV